ncbi:MAG TPA: DUF3592 domain-containing protein [Polyangiaceae bacterium]|nr:DUF3592 domain-containing protein [Polyangiaceae bacterium]
MPQLPPRPFRVLTSYTLRRISVGLLYLVGGSSLGGWLAFVEVRDALSLYSAIVTWDQGQPAHGVHVSGEESSNRGFNTYRLEVDYKTSEGAVHHAPVEFEALFASVGDDETPEVRYDAKNPERFALNWQAQMIYSRSASILLQLGFSLFLAIGGTLAGLGSFTDLATARRAAANSTEILLPVSRTVRITKRGKDTGQRRYEYQVQRPDGRIVTRSYVQERGKPGPMFADPSERSLVALVTPEAPHRPVVLGSDLSPFAR